MSDAEMRQTDTTRPGAGDELKPYIVIFKKYVKPHNSLLDF